MGYSYDKTVDFYLSSPLITPIEEDFVINYKIDSKEYILICTSETYTRALDYIKGLETKKEQSMFSAYEYNGEDIIDISEKVISFAGPDLDFHIFTNFEVKCSDITEHKLVVIKDLNFFSYTGDEYVNLIYPVHSFLN